MARASARFLSAVHKMMVTDEDLSVGVMIAFVIIIVGACVCGRVDSKRLAGHWRDKSGDLFEIRETGPRTFDVYTDGLLYGHGRVWGIRHVAIDKMPRRGWVEMEARQISFGGHDTWVYQGIR